MGRVVMRRAIFISFLVFFGQATIAQAQLPGSGVYSQDCAMLIDPIELRLKKDRTAEVEYNFSYYNGVTISYNDRDNHKKPDLYALLSVDAEKAPSLKQQGINSFELYGAGHHFYLTINNSTISRYHYCAPVLEPEIKPAFDCSEATGQVENVICQSSSLARLDHDLQEVFEKSSELVSGAELDKLVSFQHDWVKGRNECWQDESISLCVRNKYYTRIAELEALYDLVPILQEWTYQCQFLSADSDLSFVVQSTLYQTYPDSLKLTFKDGDKVFTKQKSTTGGLYVGASENSFWVKGREARYVTEENKVASCVRGG